MTPLEIILLVLTLVLAIQNIHLVCKNEQIAYKRDIIEGSCRKLLDKIYSDRRMELDNHTKKIDEEFVSQPTRVRYY